MRPLLFISITVLMATGAMVSTQYSTAQTPAGRPGKATWSYKVVHVSKLVEDSRDIEKIITSLERNLNGLGNQGWEFCNEVNGGYIFKRQN